MKAVAVRFPREESAGEESGALAATADAAYAR